MEDPIRIIGGGIGGLTTALCLHHHGIDSEVHERAPALNEIGAGLGLWPAPLAVYDRLGIGDAVRGLAGGWEQAGLRRADGSFLVSYTVEQMTSRLGGPTIGVHRGELQALLLAALPPGTVHTGQATASVDPRADRVLVGFEDGTSVAARAVIAADGRRSAIRQQLFGARPLHDCGAVGWRGTARPPAGTNWGRVAGETWGGDVVFGILPLSDGRVSWYAAARDFTDEGSRAELRSRFAHLHEPIPDLIAATRDEDIWRDRIDDLWPIRRWNAGRVALLGDAAHPMTPDLGQGACQAILDAWSIATELAADDDPADAFRRYHRARRRRAAFVVLTARALCLGGGFREGPAAAVREGVLGRLPASAMLRGLLLMAGRPDPALAAGGQAVEPTVPSRTPGSTMQEAV